MSENGEIYTAGKNFTLPPALTAWTNSTSETLIILSIDVGHYLFESCKIIHLRQNSCLTNIACFFFTGLGGAVADR